MRISGGNGLSAPQSKREFAHFWGRQSRHCSTAISSFSVEVAATRSSKRSVASCQHRYPSLCRSALTRGRPVSVFRRLIGKKRIVIGYHSAEAIEFNAVGADSRATLKNKLGRRLCRKNQSSLPQLPYSALPVVLKATLNVVSQVQAQAWSHQKCWAQTAPAQSSQVLPLACCVTTQASTAAANLTNRAPFARAYQWNRRRSVPAAAVLRFGDGI